MNRSIKTRIHYTLQKIGIQDTAIEDQADLLKDLGLDSLDVAELVVELEKEFNVSISDELVYDIKTVKDIENIIIKLFSQVV
ncbi:MAG: acyl carrier protein [Candidatus Cyclobacteriaceae bacterium M3_2C_046]